MLVLFLSHLDGLVLFLLVVADIRYPISHLPFPLQLLLSHIFQSLFVLDEGRVVEGDRRLRHLSGLTE